MKIAGLIAAAGTSSRMGCSKALLALHDTTFVEHLVKTFISADINPVLVTVPQGLHGQEIITLLNHYPVLQIPNQFPTLGLIGSIRSCLKSLPNHIEQLIIAPVDSPLVSKELLVTLAHLASAKPVVIPTFHKKRGHPIMVSRSFFAKLNTKEADLGIKQFLQNQSYMVHELSWHNEQILHNINTPEDYKKLKT